MSEQRDEGRDWIDRVVAVAEALGFNGVRLRWKLLRLRERGLGLGDRLEVARRTGAGLPSSTWILGVALALVYARVLLAAPGDGLLDLDTDVLIRFGANWSLLVAQGEWWRLVTSCFLHIGLWHLGFNLFALAFVGPAVEELFGRWRMLLLFLLTGVLASGASAFFHDAISAGASGGLMGLMGVVAGWGQRDGTSAGRAARNFMLKWAGISVAAGLFIGADNVAHLGGLVSGAVLGYALRPAWLTRTARILPQAGAVLGLGGVVAAAMLTVLPPPSATRSWQQGLATTYAASDELDEACRALGAWMAVLEPGTPEYEAAESNYRRICEAHLHRAP